MAPAVASRRSSAKRSSMGAYVDAPASRALARPRCAPPRTSGGGLLGPQAPRAKASARETTNGAWIFVPLGVISILGARSYSLLWEAGPALATILVDRVTGSRGIRTDGYRVFPQVDDRKGRVGHVPDDGRSGEHQGRR